MYIADSAGTIQGIARRSRLFEWKLERREGKPTKANSSKDGDAKPPGLRSLCGDMAAGLPKKPPQDPGIHSTPSTCKVKPSRGARIWHRSLGWSYDDYRDDDRA
jgi:hypothetical protein